ncbi:MULTISPECIES: hypothetical protein [unclassified Plantibacter]|uniref:hypothetical protein n=1 Tax=unclassified Plantibacter TaxID=2624265 RepID=UPI000B32EECA|nr:MULTISPECIES: hypothetical protein [unclassified Plantibacter]
MPHVNDKHLLQTARTELGIPLRILREMAGTGRLRIDDQPAGQREFNGLLFRCLTTTQALNPWDWSVGRSFHDLQSYAQWGAATRSAFLLATNAPARVAAYLLPHAHGDRGNAPHERIAGIPGLRLLRASADSIVLDHLPTGATLELTERRPGGADQAWIAGQLQLELDTVRRRTRVPLFQHAALTEHEVTAYGAFHRPSELLSSLAARIGLWWELGEWATLHPKRRNSTLGTLSWSAPQRGGSIVDRLAQYPVSIPSASITVGVTGLRDMNPYLFLGQESLELDEHPGAHRGRL